MRYPTPTIILGDNTAAFKWSKAEKMPKHVYIRYQFVRDAVSNCIVTVKHCPSEQMVADIMAKALPGAFYRKLRIELGIRSTTVDSSVKDEC